MQGCSDSPDTRCGDGHVTVERGSRLGVVLLRELLVNRLHCNWAVACAAVMGLAVAASADSIQIQGDMANSSEGLADYTGLIDWSFPGVGNTGTVAISLTNQSAVGGFITAFVFNVDSADTNLSISLTSASNGNFSELLGADAGPFGGPYDGGASIGGGFLGGGSPSGGIAVGDTATFVFSITANDAGSLSALSFLDGPSPFNFIVRFRGLDDGGSDMVPGTLVPAPGAIALLAAAGLIGRRRRPI